MSYVPLIARVDSLPPLPESVLKLEKVFLENNPNIDEIVKIIEADPSLTADILAKVNAPFYGFSKSIISILQAVTLFGSTQIRSLVLNSSIGRNFDIDLTPYNLSTAEFSKISTMQSELMFQWYMGINIEIARAITPIAFLMEIGKILIAKDILDTDKTKSFLNDLESYDDISYVENIYTMMTTAQINALIFKHLHLNDNFSTCMQYLDKRKDVPPHMLEMVQALQIIRTAINIQDQLSEDSLSQARTLLTQYNYGLDGFDRAVKRIQRKYLD